VIDNARIVDGLGGPARERVDAGGLVLAPGIVDIHTHLLLFDLATVGRGAKRRVNDLPTGASRLDTPAVGLHGVWVNGVRTVDEREVVSDCGRPGRVLRDFAG
jgi:predicted amidohydrolase YtcJ